jgi:hypothetical protein
MTHQSELRNPEADATRAAFAAQAERVAGHLGWQPSETGSATDWAYRQGQWQMCWVWLGNKAGDAEPIHQQNTGFRISWAPGHCVTEVWAPGRRLDLTEHGLPLPATIEQLLNLAIGIS